MKKLLIAAALASLVLATACNGSAGLETRLAATDVGVAIGLGAVDSAELTGLISQATANKVRALLILVRTTVASARVALAEGDRARAAQLLADAEALRQEATASLSEEAAAPASPAAQDQATEASPLVQAREAILSGNTERADALMVAADQAAEQRLEALAD